MNSHIIQILSKFFIRNFIPELIKYSYMVNNVLRKYIYEKMDSNKMNLFF